MYAGAVGAVAAGGAAAVYSQREKISAGWGWAQSHLLFVGALVRVEDMKKRVDTLEKAVEERGGGCANLFTKLGKGASEGWGVTETVTATVGGEEVQVGRTFCNLPVKAKEQIVVRKKIEGGAIGKQGGMRWLPATNDKARDEATAHMNMFTPRDNPGFYALAEKAKGIVVGWVEQSWYASSERKAGQVDGEMGIGDGWVTPDLEEERKDHTGIGKGWEGVDARKSMEADGDVRMREGKERDLEDSVIVDRVGGEA